MPSGSTPLMACHAVAIMGTFYVVVCMIHCATSTRLCECRSAQLPTGHGMQSPSWGPSVCSVLCSRDSVLLHKLPPVMIPAFVNIRILSYHHIMCVNTIIVRCKGSYKSAARRYTYPCGNASATVVAVALSVRDCRLLCSLVHTS